MNEVKHKNYIEEVIYSEVILVTYLILNSSVLEKSYLFSDIIYSLFKLNTIYVVLFIVFIVAMANISVQRRRKTLQLFSFVCLKILVYHTLMTMSQFS